MGKKLHCVLTFFLFVATLNGQDIDLIITNLQNTPSLVCNGESYKLNYNLKNLGSGLESFSFTSVVISKDSIPSVDDKILSVQYHPCLIKKDTTCEILYKIEGLTNGSYFFIIETDFNKFINESNETNNYLIQAVEVVSPYIDLSIKVDSLISDNYICGEWALIKYAVENLGPKSIKNYTSGVYLSMDSIIDNGDVLLTWNSEYYGFFQLIFPYKPSGTYYLIFTADINSSLTDYNPLNNTWVKQIELNVEQSDLVIQQINLPSHILIAGESVSAEVVIRNIGTTKTIKKADLIMVISKDTIYDDFDSRLFTTSNYDNTSFGQIESQQQEVYKLSAKLSDNIGPGIYYLLTICDAGMELHETNENNNINKLKIEIRSHKHPTFDLGINVINLPQPFLTSGTLVKGSLSLNGFTQNSFTDITIALSDDNLFSLNDQTFYIMWKNFNGDTAFFEIQIPNHIRSGSYYLLAIADPNNRSFETNENNNLSILPVSILPSDLDVSVSNAFILSSNKIRNEVFDFYYTVQNLGYSRDRIHLKYYLSSDSLKDNSDILLHQSIIYSLNDKISGISKITFPFDTPNGDYYLILSASIELNDINLVNNEFPVKIRVTDPQTDLQPLKIYNVPDKIQTSEEFNPKAIIINNGLTICSGAQYFYYLSTDSIFSYDDYIVKNGTIADIPSKNVHFLEDQKISFHLSGEYYLILIADLYNHINETNELNNIFVSNKKITFYQPLIDLSTEVTVINKRISYDHTLQYILNVKVKNIGNDVPFNPKATCTVYISKDTIADQTDISFSSIRFLTEDQNSFTVTIHQSSSYNNYLNGTHYLIVNVEYQNPVYEANKTNNAAHVQVEYTKPVADLKLSYFRVSKDTLKTNEMFSVDYEVLDSNSPTIYYSPVIYLSKDTIIDASDRAFYNTRYISIYDNLPSGKYYLIAKVTPRQYEINISDNQKIKEIYLIKSNSLNDFIVNYALPEKSKGFKGEKIKTAYHYGNCGERPTNNYANSAIYLSSDTVWGEADVYMEIFNSYSNNGGKYFIIPYNINTGNYYLLYFADNLNGHAETNELNNISYVPFEVTEGFIDIAAESIELINSNDPALPFTAIATFKNIGTIASKITNYEIAFNINKTGYRPNNNSNKWLKSIQPGDTAQIKFSFNPANFIFPNDADSIYLHVYADMVYVVTNNGGYTTDYNAESNESNNFLTVRIPQTNHYADLEITNVFCNDTLGIKETQLLAAHIKNNSPFNLKDVKFEKYFSKDSILSVDDISDYYLRSHITLEPKENRYITQHLNKNSFNYFTPGKYYLIYAVNTSGNIQDTVLYNNYKSCPVTVRAANNAYNLDLQVETKDTLILQASQGNFNVKFKVANIGTSSASRTIIDYYLTKDTIMDFYDLRIKTSWPNFTFYPNSNNLFSEDLNINARTVSGNYFLAINVYDKEIREVNEKNNWIFIPIKIKPPSVDITIGNAQVESVYPGEEAKIQFYLINKGFAPATQVFVSLSFSEDPYIKGYHDNDNFYLGNVTADTVFEHDSILVTYYVKAKSKIMNLNNWIILKAEAGDNIQEIDESNNIKIIPITFKQPEYDFTVTTKIQAINYYQYPSSKIKLEYNFSNSGPASVDKSGLGIYLSTDTIFSMDDQPLAILNTGTINGSGNELRTLEQYYNKRELTDTFYYVLSYADYLNEFRETNETNNIHLTKFSIEALNIPESNKTNAGMLIYPNPTNGLVQITLEDVNEIARFEIFTIEGKLVSSKEMFMKNDSGIIINTEPFSKGIYILKATAKNKIYSVKLVVE